MVVCTLKLTTLTFFIDSMVQDANNVVILLDMLEENDFYVRFHVVTLLSMLVLNNTPRLQECILTSPMGMSRLMALLDDRREIIRNGKRGPAHLGWSH